MGSVWQDTRHAIRTLTKSPGFAAIAIVTIALSIGANTSIFAIVKQVLLTSVGMRNPNRLVRLYSRNLSQGIPQDHASPALYEDWRTQSHVFAEMAAAADTTYTLTGTGEPLSLPAWRVSANFMHVLGAEPLMGRTFVADDENPASSQVVLLSYKLWQRSFGGNSHILGRILILNDRPHTVIGVMPRDFTFPSDMTEIWTPLVLPAGIGTNRNFKVLRVIARMKDGITLRDVERDLQQLSSRLTQQYPDTDRGWDVKVEPLRDTLVGNIRGPLLTITGAVAFLLLITCANIANLLLARATGRHKEMAVRVALGASRRRILRQLLTESVLLAVAGCGLGLIFAGWATGLLVRLFPNNVANVAMPRVEQIPLDATVAAFSIALALVTGMLFGMAPALQLSAVSPVAGLKDEGGRSTAGSVSRRLQTALVVTQVSLALVLLVCAGLMIRSFVRLQTVDLGFNPSHVLTMYTSLPQRRYPTDADRMRFVQQAEMRIRALTGVQSAAAVNFLPLTGYWGTMPVSVQSAPAAPVPQWPEADSRIVSADYFKAMQIAMLRGRGFTAQDTPQSPQVCIVNATFARQFFRGEDPVGKSLTFAAGAGEDRQQCSIVAVVGDVKHFGAAEPVHAEVYRPFTQVGFPFLAFAVRTGPDPMAMAGLVRRAIWQVDKDLALTRVLPMEEAAAQTTTLRRVSMIIFGFFAVTALALAALGIYGVVSYLTGRRTREFGIRIALGARSSDILRMVVGQSLITAAAGLVLGSAVALAITRLLSSLLFDVRATDPLTFVAVAVLLSFISLVAAWLPARRAARLEPLRALHHE